ncbi:MAG: alpha/beta hydrolase [Anaerolineales bacterium]
MAFHGWTVRVQPAGEMPARLLLLVHGWTGDENSMWVFVRNLAAHYWIIAPRAPHVTEPTGYSWRPRPAEDHDRPSFEDLRPAVESLIRFVDDYAAENHLDASQFDVMGFSQGAALVSVMALLHPERIGRLGVLAGFVPSGAESLAGQRPLMGKNIFVAHGTLDDRVNVELARRSVQVLQEAGASVTYCEDEVGHKLSANCLRALQAFFT